MPSPLLHRIEAIGNSAAKVEEKLFQFANENPIEDSELRKAVGELSELLRKWLREG